MVDIFDYISKRLYVTIGDTSNDLFNGGKGIVNKIRLNHAKKLIKQMIDDGRLIRIISEEEPPKKYIISKDALKSLINDYMKQQLVFYKEDIKALLFNNYPPIIVEELWKYIESDEFNTIFAETELLIDGRVCATNYSTQAVYNVIKIYDGIADGAQIARHFREDVLSGKYRKSKVKNVPFLDMVLTQLCNQHKIIREDVRKNLVLFQIYEEPKE